MLNKWQMTAVILLTKEDLNTTVEFVKDSNLSINSANKVQLENMMRRTILRNIRKFVKGNELCTVLIQFANGEKISAVKKQFYGASFVYTLWNKICKSNGVRIKITKANGQTKTWIFIKK